MYNMIKKVKSAQGAKNPRAEKILTAAESLFFKVGVRKTTVGDICQAAGISRMTFYKHFRDKTHVAEAAVNKIVDEMTAQFRSIMNQDIPYRDRIRQFIEMKLTRAEGIGESFVRELYGSPCPELQALVRRRMDENQKLALDEYRKAQRRGHLRPDIKPEFLVAVLNIMTDLMVDERLTRLYSTPTELAAELMNLFFFGILKNGDKE